MKTLALNERPAAIRVTERSGAPSATTAATRVAALVRATTPRGNAPVVAGKRFVGGRIPSPVSTPAVPAVPAPVQKTLQPVQQTTDPLFDAVSNPGTTAGAVANGTQQVTDAVGNGTAKLSPQLGDVVTSTGQAVAQTVRDLPLPQHVLPNH